jgi:cyclic pyranopterin phosphate synthase
MDREGKRLHICLGIQCNNNCIFCMEEDRESRARRLEKIDTATVERILASYPQRNEVLFTAGEPTLRPDLIDLVARARSLGYRIIGLITNARRLAYADYLQRLLSAGLNHLLVSVHGHTERLHDGLTRTPGSFAQSVEGMRNVAAARQQGWTLRFVATCVLNRRNLEHVADIVRFFRQFGADQVVFNAIQPVGRGERLFDRLVPRYSDMIAAMARGLAELGPDCEHVYLVDVPRCVAVSLPPAVVGYVEQHRHFEPLGEILDSPLAHNGKELQAEVEGKLALVTKEAVDGVLRSFGPRCSECDFDADCDGIWTVYAKRFGFDEFVPVRGHGGGER